MRKMVGAAVVALLAGCASPEEQAAWNQAVAQLPPGSTSYCELQAQQVSAAYYRPASVLGLEQMAAANQTRQTCLRMLVEQNGGIPQIAKPVDPRPFAEQHIAKYGKDAAECYKPDPTLQELCRRAAQGKP